MSARTAVYTASLPTPRPVETASPATGTLLTADIDRCLIQRYQKTRDAQAQQQLVQRHERLVWSIAWRYRGNGEPIEDLAQEGFIGLIRAMERYDCSSPAKFSSYASLKIAGYIEHYLRDRSTAIRRPGWLQELLARIRKERQRLTQELGRQPNIAEIAMGLGETEDRIAAAMETAATQSVSSLDEPVSSMESDSPSLSDVIADPGEQDDARLRDERMDLERAMKGLDDVHQQALRLCFFEELTFEEAGGRMGMDRHRTRRVVNQAVRLLRKQLQAA